MSPSKMRPMARFKQLAQQRLLHPISSTGMIAVLALLIPPLWLALMLSWLWYGLKKIGRARRAKRDNRRTAARG